MDNPKVKRKIYFYLLIVLPLILLVLVNIGLFVKKSDKKNIDESKNTAEERYYQTIKQKNPIDADWKINIGDDTGNQPQVTGTSGLIIDNLSGKVLFGLNTNEKRPIASLVKIVTAIVAIEHKDLDEEIMVSGNAASVGENSMGISKGEAYTLKELLYGMMLTSGNDSATAIAEGVAGDVETFIKWMNIKASELGLSNTYFADPDGLNDSSYSTAEDLAKLTHYALGYPDFQEIVKTFEQEYTYSERHKYIYLENQTNLLTTYPGVLGVKTGYTKEAGLCLITYSVNEGRELLGVVLNSADRKGDMITMLDYGFSLLGIKIEHPLLGQ
jgi:serine-type D-Ala-D-Ala carboxypeptidase (penicillin-binding protein 5/6)